MALESGLPLGEENCEQTCNEKLSRGLKLISLPLWLVLSLAFKDSDADGSGRQRFMTYVVGHPI